MARRILVVDDEPAVRLLLKRILNGEYDVMEASGGKSALEIVSKSMPDLIVLDLMMPCMDGWEFLEKFNKIKSSKMVPVLILSARSQASEVMSGLAVEGVKDYITKPFTKDHLLIRIKEALE